jgi:hypothetical protein
MALHVAQVASPLLASLAASIRRPAAGNATAGQPASTATPAAQADSSFQSLLTRNLPAGDPAAAVITAAGQRATATTTSVAASSAASAATGTAADSSSAAGASGLSDFELLFGGSSYNATATPVTTAAVPSTSSSGDTAAASSSTASASGLSDFELTFGGSSYNPADPLAASRAASTNSVSATEAPAPPTAQSVFGPNVWMTDPIGLNPDGTNFEYNPIYFATENTAQAVAQLVGGTVVAKDMITTAGGPFVQLQPNYMVQMPNGALINPGLVASFYTFGFSQSQVDTMIAQEVANTPPPAQTT